MFELVKKDKPQYADKDIVAYHKRTADKNYADMDRKFKEETSRIRQEMYKMQADMNLMRIELDGLLNKHG